jgi:hypothetical protein
MKEGGFSKEEILKMPGVLKGSSHSRRQSPEQTVLDTETDILYGSTAGPRIHLLGFFWRLILTSKSRVRMVKCPRSSQSKILGVFSLRRAIRVRGFWDTDGYIVSML